MAKTETPKHCNGDGETVNLEELERLADLVATAGGGFGRVCAMCGRAFVAMNPRARYCSAACRQKAYRERKRKRRPEARIRVVRR